MINNRLIKALRREPVDVTPVWIMRQAGRYLPEYRKVREQAKNFMTVCSTPELACEVTLQPLARFNLDAAIIFSDILTIPDAMGLGLYFVEGEGPKFKKQLSRPTDIKALFIPDMETELRYVMDAIRLVQHDLAGKLPLLGFSGSPWTLATYMIEGGSSKTFSKIKKMLFDNSRLLHELLEVLTTSVTAYLNAQIAAGVNAVMLFDTWGGVLSQRDYVGFSLQYMEKIISNLDKGPDGESVPTILFTKNAGPWLEKLATSGCDAVGLDWTIEMGDARKRIGSRVALQGNMDPAVLYASPQRIRQEVKTILTSYGKGEGHIFNLGHGINPDVSPEHVAVLVDAVHELSKVNH